MCEPACERLFLTFPGEKPPAVHGLVWEEPAQIALGIHTPLHACSQGHLRAHVCAHVYVRVFALHHRVPTERLAHAAWRLHAMQMSV